MIKTDSFRLATYEVGDKNARKLALVLPGKLDTKDYKHLRSHVDFLATKGFYALSFDPPGSWESPGSIDIYTMSNYVKAVDELIKLFDKPTFLMGHSMGGAVAARAATSNSNVTAFASLMSALDFRDYPEDRWNDTGKSVSKRDLPENPDQEKVFSLPRAFLEDLRTFNMIKSLTQYDKPKLFLLGVYDSVVSPQKIREAYEAASEPKQLAELDSGHDYRRHTELIDKVNNLVATFLKNI